MASERYYSNASKTQVWKVTDREIRYIRFQQPVSGLVFQNITIQVDAFDPKEEAYIKIIANESDYQVYTGIYMLVLKEMKSRLAFFEEKFNVKI